MQENDRSLYVLVSSLVEFKRGSEVGCSSLLHLTSDEAETILDEIGGMNRRLFLVGPISDDGLGLSHVQDLLEADSFELATAHKEKEEEDLNYQWFTH